MLLFLKKHKINILKNSFEQIKIYSFDKKDTLNPLLYMNVYQKYKSKAINI